ncbi:peptide-methionine (R)-S-oxide reductase MsrB [Novosphingobium lentum]|uniref:peptide-methionine (R)-S-oxide reductase MsrB n=1 Tax=Novosphingobium lentum TaxID=145287 RepID=UPI00082D7548|nr:peptide-methionine (R)-S-oxide reductase MsrB [Novosphingobium lentum]
MPTSLSHAASVKIGRRGMLGWLGAGTAMTLATACGAKPSAAANSAFPLRHTDAEWRKLLTAKQYYILREEGTERPFSSALLNEHRNGTFACAADGNPVFSSHDKFDSGTGWPSFTRHLAGAQITGGSTLFNGGHEVHCSRCGGHLGHVFDDGPAPTGKRFCIDGDALVFRPA